MHAVEREEDSLLVLPGCVERGWLWPNAIRENKVGHSVVEAGGLLCTCCGPYCRDCREDLNDSFDRMHY